MFEEQEMRQEVKERWMEKREESEDKEQVGKHKRNAKSVLGVA